jgi:hypothetical protein
MEDVDKLIERIRANGDEVWIAGPQSEQAVAELEKAVGVKMPPSYREFLLRFGSFGILDSLVSGIVDNDPLTKGTGNLLWDTKWFRHEYDLPEHLLVVQHDEDAPYCLDSRKPKADGEYPMICYELRSGHVEKLAPSFAAWFKEWLQLQAEDDA